MAKTKKANKNGNSNNNTSSASAASKNNKHTAVAAKNSPPKNNPSKSKNKNKGKKKATNDDAAAPAQHPKLARAAKQNKKSKDNDDEMDASKTEAEEQQPEEAKETEEEPEDEEEQVIGAKKQSPRWKNRQRTLVISSRGIGQRMRHAMTDLRALMPHSKKDAKMDKKDKLAEAMPEICELKNCNNCVYFENRKKKDVYMWVSKIPQGPSVKFLVQNVYTMSELRMAGNGLKGSRPILTFDKNFDELPQLQLMKDLFFQTFGTPQSHPKSKPFVDRVMSFFWLDNRVWFRNYQVVWSTDSKSPDDIELSEIGPRFVLNPIRIFSGAFGGKTLFENELYISPNDARREAKAKMAQKFRDRTLAKEKTASRKEGMVLPKDEVDTLFSDIHHKDDGDDDDGDDDDMEEDDEDEDEE